jgi:hypothetical protein
MIHSPIPTFYVGLPIGHPFRIPKMQGIIPPYTSIFFTSSFCFQPVSWQKKKVFSEKKIITMSPVKHHDVVGKSS